MILRRTERDFKEALRTWHKHGRWDEETHTVTKTKTTWWLLFIPIFSYEKINKSAM